ncbi:hypothetical protein K503DRAFT_133847 [Rhizopogon vinicolor AM-OR11-026]|uniref:Uncharacterized protein n=1 Tax=Rhizopogon vinicolor AM-OR11-026 TaxID=1314800 RepID=A0A1B7MEH8_9AGAM|nr:hypothetical protein K503DRAFT_133847 [Rhizopogon vinicolor AM-OR11-026]
MGFCWGLSFLFGVNVHASSALLIVVDFVRDDFGLSHHYISKNFCTVGGYATLELGATLVLCRKFYISENKYFAEQIDNLAGESSLDRMALTAPACRALIRFAYFPYFLLFLPPCGVQEVVEAWATGLDRRRRGVFLRGSHQGHAQSFRDASFPRQNRDHCPHTPGQAHH